MQLSPQDVTALLQREGSGLSPEAYDEVTEPEEAQPRRTKLLADVLETCQQALQQKSSSLEVIAKTLGDGSRDGRLPSPLPVEPELHLASCRRTLESNHSD